MRHLKSGTKLNRTASHRKALLRNMVTSLFEHEKIVTTDTKAKALRPLAERMITLAKRGDLHAMRQAMAVITKKQVVYKLFGEIKDRYMEVSGGYTSIVKIGIRRGDAAPLSAIELVDFEARRKAEKKSRKKAKKAAPQKAQPAEEPVAAPAAEETPAEG